MLRSLGPDLLPSLPGRHEQTVNEEAVSKIGTCFGVGGAYRIGVLVEPLFLLLRNPRAHLDQGQHHRFPQ